MLNVEQLETKIKDANHAYRNTSSPIMADEAYDQYVAELKALDPNNSLLLSVEPETDFGSGKIRHTRPMLSTDKLYTESDIAKWVKRVLAAGGEYVVITPKLDGMAGRLEKGVLASRGDGTTGNNISHMLARNLIVLGGDGDGEIIIEQAYFDEHLKDVFMHPRNTVTGAVSAESIREEIQLALESGAIRFVNYSSLNSIKVNVVELANSLDEIRRKLLDASDYLTDGLIIEVEGEAVREKLGSTGHHHNWRVAAKEVTDTADVTVKSITWQVGRSGRLTPVINIEPTRLSGAVISNVTGHNAGHMIKHQIGIGGIIRIKRSGEVIPAYVETIKRADVSIPACCPCCNSEIVSQNDFVLCVNENCDEKLTANLNSFFEKIGVIDLFGPASCEKLVKGGYREPVSVFGLEASDFEKLGFGPGQSSNLVREINESKFRPVDDFKLMAAMGIENLGRGDSKKLLKHYPIEELATLTKEDIIAIDGFGELTSRTIADEMKVVASKLKFFNDYFENIIRTPLKSNVESNTPIAGMNIVFTGKMLKGAREEMEAGAEALGAKCQKSVNKKTNLLVVGEKVGQTKLQKAKALNIEIKTEDEYLDLIRVD